MLFTFLIHTSPAFLLTFLNAHYHCSLQQQLKVVCNRLLQADYGGPSAIFNVAYLRHTEPEKLADHPGFIALGEAHHQMHMSATKLLMCIEEGLPISTYDYDYFSNNLEKMRLQLSTLRRELSGLLYNRDTLTGAINRINMLPFLREQQELIKRSNQPCSIAMMDFDFFKKVNDSYGHAAGDIVLSQVLRYIMENLRAFDKVFRIGGEEFLLCLVNADIQMAQKMIERLRTGIATLPIFISKSKSIEITVSFGIASLNAETSVENSIELTDKGLYQAKNDGRNCSRIYSP